MSKESEALKKAKMEHSIIKQGFPELEYFKTLDDIEKELKVLEIIKSADFSLEFDEIQNEWFLYISEEEQHILVAKGAGVKTYKLLMEVLL